MHLINIYKYLILLGMSIVLDQITLTRLIIILNIQIKLTDEDLGIIHVYSNFILLIIDLYCILEYKIITITGKCLIWLAKKDKIENMNNLILRGVNINYQDEVCVYIYAYS